MAENLGESDGTIRTTVPAASTEASVLELPAVIDIRLDKIWKKFGATVALQGVDFRLRGGEVHVLLGENGAGKSTLVKVVSGVHQPDSGTISIDCRECVISSPRKARTFGIATVFQEFSLFQALTVAENLHLPHLPTGYLGRVKEKNMAANARRILERLGARELDPLAPVFSLTVGERQLVEIARSMMINARLVIMDEPTAALNGAEIQQLFHAIRQLKSDGVGVLYISHRLEEVKEIADKITVIRDGRVAGQLEPQHASISEIVQLMVGRDVAKGDRQKQHASSGESVLELSGLSRPPYFSGVDLTIHKGETVGVTGLAGAGAVELAHALFGDPPAASGVVRLGDDAPVKLKSPRHSIGCGIGMISEDRAKDGLALGASVKENLSMVNLSSFLRWGVIRWKSEESSASRLVKSLRIVAASVDAEASSLSGGNQQKLVIAKWTHFPLKVLVVVEPTRGVDVGAREDVYALLDKLKNRGVGIFLVSSDLREIARCCDRVYIMRRGVLTDEFVGDKIMQDHLLQATLK